MKRSGIAKPPTPTARRATWRQLERLLDLRNEHPERLAEIDRRITRAFAHRRAVLVLDMCGFSRLTIRHGIVHFLAMIRRLHRAMGPVVRQAGGHIVKTEADNVFAIFADVPKAVAAAIALRDELSQQNQVLPEDWDLQVGIGIGHGDILMVGDQDFYGSEVNLASKLGEDVAGPGEILLTPAAAARVPKLRHRLRRRRQRLSGLDVAYFALLAAPVTSASPDRRGRGRGSPS